MHFFLQESKAHHVDPSRLIEITKSSDLFKKVFEEQGNDKIQIACCRQMAVKSFNPGEIIIRFGEPAKDFFVILEGRVSIRIPHSRSKPTFDLPRVNEEAKAESNKWNLKNKAMGVVFLNKVLGYETHEEVKILHPGESFGELALISDRPRAATVIAKSKVLLGILSKDVFQKQLARYAEKSLIDKINFLQSLPMFRMRSRLQLMKISYYFSLKKTSWNQFLYKEGEPASALFIVKSGEFMVNFK
jgi:CRP-like cAMP-binding protein